MLVPGGWWVDFRSEWLEMFAYTSLTTYTTQFGCIFWRSRSFRPISAEECLFDCRALGHAKATLRGDSNQPTRATSQSRYHGEEGAEGSRGKFRLPTKCDQIVPCLPPNRFRVFGGLLVAISGRLGSLLSGPELAVGQLESPSRWVCPDSTVWGGFKRVFWQKPRDPGPRGKWACSRSARAKEARCGLVFGP